MLLALDTSTRYSGIALYAEGRVLLEHTWQSAHYHTRHLAPAVEGALSIVGAQPADLKGIVVALGPGSFTGLRIGLAFGKGLALARHIPIVGISTLDFLAAAQMPSELPLLAVLRAGRGRYSLGEYRWENGGWHPAGALSVLTLPELTRRAQSPCVICGEFPPEARQTLRKEAPQARLVSPAASLRRPAYLAELGWQRLRNGERDDPVTLAPIYLHFPTAGKG